MKYSFIGYQSGKWSESFCIDIKTIEHVKKQPMFQRKMEDFNGKQVITKNMCTC